MASARERCEKHSKRVHQQGNPWAWSTEAIYKIQSQPSFDRLLVVFPSLDGQLFRQTWGEPFFFFVTCLLWFRCRAYGLSFNPFMQMQQTTLSKLYLRALHISPSANVSTTVGNRVWYRIRIQWFTIVFGFLLVETFYVNVLCVAQNIMKFFITTILRHDCHDYIQLKCGTSLKIYVEVTKVYWKHVGDTKINKIHSMDSVFKYTISTKGDFIKYFCELCCEYLYIFRFIWNFTNIIMTLAFRYNTKFLNVSCIIQDALCNWV